MRCLKLAVVLIGGVLATPVMAFESTTDVVVRSLYASQQVTSSFSNNKIVREAQGDAASFVASEGQIRGAHLEAAFQEVRKTYPDLKITDLELAEAILAQ